MRHHHINVPLSLMVTAAATCTTHGFILRQPISNISTRNCLNHSQSFSTFERRHKSIKTSRLIPASTLKLPPFNSIADTNADKTSSGVHHPNKSFLIVPILYSLASLALIYKSYAHANNLPDASLYLSTAALCLFNVSNADRKRLVVSNNANTKYLGIANSISTTQQIDEAERNRYAAERYATALAVKTFGQLAGLLRMILDVSTNPSGGAALFMMTQVVYFIVGGGRYRHNDDGTLNPIEDRLVVGASTTYGLFTVAALVAGRTALDSVARGVATAIYCLGCLTGAFEGAMGIIFGTHRITSRPGKGEGKG